MWDGFSTRPPPKAAAARSRGRVENPSHMNLPLVVRLTRAAHYSARLFSPRPARDSGFVQDRLLLRASTH